MDQGKPIVAAARYLVAICLAAFIFALGPTTDALGAQPAIGKSAAPKAEDTTPTKIHELLTLLSDPKVREWLEKQSEAKAAADSAPADVSVSRYFDARLADTRTHIVA